MSWYAPDPEEENNLPPPPRLVPTVPACSVCHELRLRLAEHQANAVLERPLPDVVLGDAGPSGGFPGWSRPCHLPMRRPPTPATVLTGFLHPPDQVTRAGLGGKGPIIFSVGVYP